MSPQLVLRLGWPPVKRSLPATTGRLSADTATDEQDR